MRDQFFTAGLAGALKAVLIAAFTVGGLVSVAAKELKVGTVTIEQAWSRATPKGAPVGAGYLRLTNTGSSPDRLVGGSTAIAARLEIHEMKMDGGIMRMRRLANGIVLPPGKTIELKPGGHHLMFIKLSTALEKSKPFKATLQFERAGSVDVQFTVEAIGAAAPSGGGHGQHKH